MISSGALGLSLAFIKDIVPLDKVSYNWLFYVAIGLFVVVIAIGLINHFRSSDIIANQIAIVEQEEYDQLKNDTSIRKWNIFIAGALIGGIVALSLFVILNLNDMSKKGSSKPQNQSTTKKVTVRYKRAMTLKPVPNNLNPNSTTPSSASTPGTGNKSSTNKKK